MKSKYILLFLSIYVPVFCQESENLYKQAQHSQEAGNYQEALTLYTSIAPAGWGILYNQALCLHALHRDTDALVLLYRAQKIAQRSELCCQDMIQRINTVLHLESSEFQSPYYTAGFTNYSLLFWQLFCIASCIILCYCFMAGYTGKIIYGYFVFTFLILLIVFYVHHTNNKCYAVVMHNQSLQPAMHPTYDSLTSIAQGSVVQVQTIYNDWCKVKYGSMQGWLPISVLTQI